MESSTINAGTDLIYDTFNSSTYESDTFLTVR
jgi:hypothetical protein